VGANPLSVHPETGKPGYNLSADVLSLRKLSFENMDAWIDKLIKMEADKGEKK
jgi:hypothetical protein